MGNNTKNVFFQFFFTFRSWIRLINSIFPFTKKQKKRNGKIEKEIE
jgi:hypothetical protein